MSATELHRWWAWYQLEPWGETRGDFRMGILAATLVNLWSGKGSKRVTPADFMPDWYTVPTFTPRPRQTAAEMFNILKQGTIAVGGRIQR